MPSDSENAKFVQMEPSFYKTFVKLKYFERSLRKHGSWNDEISRLAPRLLVAMPEWPRDSLLRVTDLIADDALSYDYGDGDASTVYEIGRFYQPATRQADYHGIRQTADGKREVLEVPRDGDSFFASVLAALGEDRHRRLGIPATDKAAQIAHLRGILANHFIAHAAVYVDIVAAENTTVDEDFFAKDGIDVGDAFFVEEEPSFYKDFVKLKDFERSLRKHGSWNDEISGLAPKLLVAMPEWPRDSLLRLTDLIADDALSYDYGDGEASTVYEIGRFRQPDARLAGYHGIRQTADGKREVLEVPRDGDSFFASVLVALGEDRHRRLGILATDKAAQIAHLRGILANHFIAHAAVYVDIVAAENTSVDEDFSAKDGIDVGDAFFVEEPPTSGDVFDLIDQYEFVAVPLILDRIRSFKRFLMQNAISFGRGVSIYIPWQTSQMTRFYCWGHHPIRVIRPLRGWDLFLARSTLEIISYTKCSLISV